MFVAIFPTCILASLGIDVAEVNQRRWLEESGQRLENVEQTHVVQPSGKSVLQKTIKVIPSQVQNMRSDLTYRFSIVNFSKPDSLYNYGMKPVLYSEIEAERHFVGWSRVGSNIRLIHFLSIGLTGLIINSLYGASRLIHRVVLLDGSIGLVCWFGLLDWSTRLFH